MKPITQKIIAAIAVPFALSGLAYALFIYWPQPARLIQWPPFTNGFAITNWSIPRTNDIWLDAGGCNLARITDATTNGFILRTGFKPCEARVTNGQWTIHFKR